MASLTCTPTSLQLRLAFAAPKFPHPPHVRMRNFKLNRLRPLRAAQDGVSSEWAGPGPKLDGFSGWSDTDAEQRPNNAPKKDSYGGVVGVGVAGVLLLSGLTFAALSLGKQTGSRPEQHMKTLTTQQEELLSSDDHNDEITEQGNVDSMVEQGNGKMEGQIDISGDYSSAESSNFYSDNSIVDDSDIGSQLIYDSKNPSDGVDDATKHISVQEDLQDELAFGNKLVFASESPVPLESENTIDSFNAYGFRDFDSNPNVDTAESTANLKENLFNVDPGDAPNYDDAKPLHLNTEQHDEITSSSGSVSAEGNEPSFEERSVPGNDLFEESSISSSVNTLVDEQVTNDNYEVDEVKSKSPNSGSFFSVPGIPAPSVVSASVQVLPGKVLVPAAVDQVQGQALAALQVLKVIEPDVQPSDLCTRREYARWLVSASSALSRSTVSKVYPAMYIDNVTELAFDDVIPEDPDFSSIQGLAEAGLIESRLSRRDIQLSAEEDDSPFYFSPESPLSRQDLVSWKMALEKRQLPEANRKVLYQVSGFIDTDKIHPNACPALVADLSSGEQGIIALAFGYTRLFQPDKPVTKAQAAMALATGDASEIVSEELARIEAESVAENAVAAHSALVAQVEKDINASFEQELFIEREKISAVERMAEEARLELERLRAEREEDNLALTKERAAIDSEMEVFSKLRHEVEDQLQSLMNDRVEIAHEKERISKLREQAEVENKEICRLQYELEVERKALSMARAWAEDEAKRVREQAIALEEARDRWERHGIKVVVDDDLRKEASAGVTWLNASEQVSVQGTVDRAESLLDKLKQMAADIRGKSRDTLDKIIHMVSQLISKLREWACKTGKQAEEFGEAAISKVGKSASELQLSALEVGSGIKEGAKRVAGDCREGVEKITQKFTQKFKT
ncbi:hypothetical protein AAZX31_09G124900 [Glycine max]|uniref:SLH domain-containing protein n=2 Tax=Glycine soja TaxID=3848 RepID=A0A445J0M0_GLYSO|nr:uncharacterized protein LOC100780360 isoform X5 [Glycine max]XP_028181196.1 uncharacterized protein LOC114368053 isoform X1 [Glycine soja]KRH38456.2 hypothetical protein GLYMA_09G136800v4 [Glycine max]RZB91944.1 hypothetical protein D0Y65_024095 [Glycine soja]|eukprot:XP_006587299.1 uncharacterized protein LOC100780360 isoform X5 [Glycine max]